MTGNVFGGLGSSLAAPQGGTHSARIRRTVVWAAPVAVIGLAATLAQAESGRVDQVVGGNLRVIFDTLGLPSLGYRPIRVHVVPLMPNAAPRVLTLEAVVKSSGSQPSELVVTQRLELPPGATPVETVFSLPAGSIGECLLGVLEDGRPIAGMQRQAAVPLDIEFDTVDVFPRVLAVSPAPPDFGELARAVRRDVTGESVFAGGDKFTLDRGTRSFAWRPRSQLPRRWIDHSSADLVCISLADLAALRAEDSEALAALLDWAASGGNLVVSGVGKRQERLGVLESLLGMNPLAEGAPHKTAWRSPDPALRDQPLPAQRLFSDTADTPAKPFLTPEGMPVLPPEGTPAAGAPNAGSKPASSSAGVATGAQPKAKPAPSEPSAEDAVFWLRPYYWGMVVAWGPERIWPGTAGGWRWMLNAVGHDRWLWDRRYGVSVIQDNPEFWNFLIPGVGLAPVAGFEVLITVFVLAVGPLNYVLLRRAKRLHLMVVTVPASAVLATGLVLVFGLVSDGLGTRVRARSITYLDQRQGRALCWARLSYYAGMAPRGGLRFPTDTLVVPYLAEPRPVSDLPSRRQVFQWNPQEQWLRSGWLASRTPTQFITLRTRPTTLGLEVVAGASDAWEVRNRLGTRIHQLVLRSPRGEYFCAADIEPGSSRLLERVGQTAGLGKFMPPVLSGPTPAYPGWSPGRWRRYGYPRPPIPDVLWQSESRLRTSRAEGRLAGPITQSRLWVSEFGEPGLAPGSYAALVERSPEVELGVDGAREVASFHLVLGLYAERPDAGSRPGKNPAEAHTPALPAGGGDRAGPSGMSPVGPTDQPH